MATIRVRCYGRLAEDAAPESSLPIAAEGLTIGSLRDRLAEMFDAPSFLDPRVRAAVGDALVQDDRIVRPGDEVDFLAPLSGG